MGCLATPSEGAAAPHKWSRTPSDSAQSRPGWVHEYRKLELLGRGSMSKVRRCVRADGTQFAMKIFDKSVLRRRRRWDCESERYIDGLDDVRREVGLMRTLRHARLVRLHEVTDGGGNPIGTPHMHRRMYIFAWVTCAHLPHATGDRRAGERQALPDH